METKEVFEETGKLGNEINRLRKLLEQVNKECLEMMQQCSHEIVFKYNDNHSRKMMIDGTYFCPACGKIIKCIQRDQIQDTPFKNSRIISLIGLSLLGTSENHYIIRNEVYNNLDLYYDCNIPVEELSFKMGKVLKDKQYEPESLEKVFKKMRNNK